MRYCIEDAAQMLKARDFDGAETALRSLINADPRDAVAYNVLGLVHLERRRYAEAIASFSQAIRLRSPYPEALINLAVACNRTGEHELAIKVSDLALAAAPGSVAALLNRGMACKGLRRLGEAKRAFELAGDHPMARFNLGHTLLLENDLERGLPLLEARREVFRTGADLAGEAWRGEARPGDTLLVLAEQGLGDHLLMSRFFPRLFDSFARVVVQTPPPLERLMSRFDPRLELVTSPEGARFDAWAPIMSLPLLLGVRGVLDLPNEPWLSVTAPERPTGRPRVGLNWAGNPSYAYDAVRSTSLETFAPLLAIGDVEWVSLHRGVREHEAEAFGLAQPLREAKDFLDTAEVIAGLDLVISTETAIPNLSAAMGVPTCVLTTMDVDWRWAAWYSGVTVCAQQTPGNWFGSIAEAAETIRTLLASRASDQAA
ncbi:MAG: tetratricopeptide repeat protein [Candidatus Eisenbacteria bacterium]|jgi:hypothetical protein|nr:tetratricopeptide repeat protein [Candidatus Eisenbacteria bacterium]